MVAQDEDALLCDFAEHYHVINWRALPLSTAAALAFGLPAQSRIKMKLSGVSVPNELLLWASMADYLALLWWRETENGQHNRKRPQSIVASLLGADKKTNGEIIAFASGEDFEKRKAEILRGGPRNGR